MIILFISHRFYFISFLHLQSTLSFLRLNFLYLYRRKEKVNVAGENVRKMSWSIKYAVHIYLFRAYPNNPWMADRYKGNGAFERIQGWTNEKQQTDIGFQTNYGRKLSHYCPTTKTHIVLAAADLVCRIVKPWTASFSSCEPVVSGMPWTKPGFVPAAQPIRDSKRGPKPACSWNFGRWLWKITMN